MMRHEVYRPDTFLYFAYGPNIFTFKMHMTCPNAEFVSIARADNYRIDFIHFSEFWAGPEVTMVSTANAHVWGVIWRIPIEDIDSLDEAKKKNIKQYYVRHIEVLTPYIGIWKCRAYIQKVNPLPRGDNDPVPVENWPSYTYKLILIMGAIEHKLPHYYINYLKKLKDNGDEGYLRTWNLLQRYASDSPCACRVPGRVPRDPLIKVLRKPVPKGALKSGFKL